QREGDAVGQIASAVQRPAQLDGRETYSQLRQSRFAPRGAWNRCYEPALLRQTIGKREQRRCVALESCLDLPVLGTHDQMHAAWARREVLVNTAFAIRRSGDAARCAQYLGSTCRSVDPALRFFICGLAATSMLGSLPMPVPHLQVHRADQGAVTGLQG